MFHVTFHDHYSMEREYNILHDLSKDKELNNELSKYKDGKMEKCYSDKTNFNMDPVSNEELNSVLKKIDINTNSSVCHNFRKEDSPVLFIALVDSGNCKRKSRDITPVSNLTSETLIENDGDCN